MRPQTRTGRWWVGLLVGVAAIGAVAPAGAQQMAFEEVVANLKVGDPRVRMDALRLLRSAGYLEAAPAIAPLLSDPVPDIQALAVETELALFLVDEAYTREYARRIVPGKGATLPLYAFAQGPGATIANPVPAAVIRGLVYAASSKAIQTQFDAAYTLGVLAPPLIKAGKFPDGKAVGDRLMAIIRDPDPTLRLAATHVLGRLMGAALKAPEANAELTAMRTEAGDQIIAGLNDPDELIRLSSMGALGEMRYDRAVQALTDLFGYYKREKLGLAALDAVAQIAHPGSVTVFAALLGDGNEHVRRIVVEGIGRTGDKGAVYNLKIRSSGEKSRLVQQAMAFARAKTGDFTLMTNVVDGFMRAELQAYAFEYLVELGAPLAPSLVGYATHPNAKVRAGVAEVLGIVGNQASLAVVEPLTRDKDKTVAAAAARSQRRLALRVPAQPRVP